ncbi:hypothetical protein BDF20DRAFT_992408 [Mycotypha africana]|uniref:uncharacterized protein n=1 Tax=Mycotypha africana TaxID=64632 RepID=UPI002301BFB2|nr:uncharacterized protein BDF20DRAFT_992408 [Mycotypha africana]KAI8990926.1 hypothetical protein BDF20DRAFT_992408 [Mycotypha africana]
MHVATLASIALEEVDNWLVDHMSECLVGTQRVISPWVQVAALDSAVLLALNFPHLVHTMTNMMCQFLANAAFAEESAEVQQHAIVRLARIVKVTSFNHLSQTALSVVHTLMNQITHQSTQGKFSKMKMALEGKQHSDQIAENVFSSIFGLAVCLRDEHVISQTFSMFTVRRKSLSWTVVGHLLKPMVNLALVSNIDTFLEIIHLMATMSKETIFNENNAFTTAILEAQRSLAKQLCKRPEECSFYLSNLLTLFNDTANAIQRIILKNKKKNGSTLIRRLGQLFPVMDALLSHDDFNPHLVEQSTTSNEVVPLFRNMWFHSVLLGLLTEPIWIREWHKHLLHIAEKTPILIIESTSHYIEIELEHSTVIRGLSTVAEQKAQVLRQKLEQYLPSLKLNTKNFSFPQVLFCTSVYHLEMLRSRSGNCSSILSYFTIENGYSMSGSSNSSDRIDHYDDSTTVATINSSSSNSIITHCLETIADQVVSNFLRDLSVKALNSIVKQQALRTQVAELLRLCCHKRKKVHQMAIKTLDRLISCCPQIFTDSQLLTLLLELVQLTWVACETQYRDEYNPVYQFTSARVNVTIELGDSYTYRKEVCAKLFESARHWLQIALSRASIEVSGLLQDYLKDSVHFSSNDFIDVVHMGRNLAIEFAKASLKNEFSIGINSITIIPNSCSKFIEFSIGLYSTDFIPKIPSVIPNRTSNFLDTFRLRQFYSGELSGMNNLLHLCESEEKNITLHDQLSFAFDTLKEIKSDIENDQIVTTERLHRVLHRSAALVIALPKINADLIRYVVYIPVQIFTAESMNVGINIWNWMLVERPETESKLMAETCNMWTWAQRHEKGLFSPLLNFGDPFAQKINYGPSHKPMLDSTYKIATQLFTPHSQWIKFLSSRFYAIRHKHKNLVHMLIRLLLETFQTAASMSTHSLARYGRFSLLQLGFKVLQSTRLEALTEYSLRISLYDAAFDWFSQPHQWNFGGHRSLALAEIRILTDVYHTLLNDAPNMAYSVTCTVVPVSTSNITAGHYIFIKDKTKEDVLKQHKLAQKLLLLLIENEISKLSVWCNPLNAYNSDVLSSVKTSTEMSMTSNVSWKEIIQFAWSISPKLAVHMDSRFALPKPVVRKELIQHIVNSPLEVVDIPEALMIILGDGSLAQHNLKNFDLKYLQYWAPVPPITAANYFSSAYGQHPILLQYAIRSLNYYPVETVFFYIPQIVQALRFDDPTLKYVENYILETAKTSQLFAHQIIWNMKANFFVDADKECQQPDALKPTLERIIETMLSYFAGEDREFYEREFKFFGEVTAISGYLKEYIKHGQTEKKPLQKKRLDEELQKIKVDVGVYLPSNPDGRVIDIDRNSGRPLQSHAKAPFMATFLTERELQETNMSNFTEEDNNKNKSLHRQRRFTKAQIWQSAIFKVGDDCRQDVLALQLIAVFKNIFMSVGLDLYLYPYRVVATAPGRGVIDVIPNSISRDQMGREKVNSLYDYFIAKYGGSEMSIAFQRARTNFVKSVAAYSIISYLLQIKDRHNGNIMVDDEGHMIHIDFGFIFDIAPGGITFENSPFKLTNEMIQVMGGGSQEQAFRQFSELVIKAYLATRPYAEQIMQLVTLMLRSGLPCFRGETIKRMRYRFQLDKSERAAAEFMTMRIKESFANQRTVLYDYFQKLTNGIPY